MIQRSEIEIVKRRFSEVRKFIQVIVGPRQVGKTTMISQLLEQTDKPYHFVSADGVLENDAVWIGQVWETARLKLKTTEADEIWLVIDEIQKTDRWSELVKREWDNDTRNAVNIKVVLLGSSRLLIQKGLTESLAGRFELIYMGHWSYAEMKEAFGWSVEQFIYFGGYPGAASLITDENRWRSYVKDALIETSISKDILLLTRINKPAVLKRLFELGCNYSGQILSYTKILGQMQDAGNTTTLSHYLKLLSDAGMLGGIEKFAGDVIRKRSSSPKFQVYNNALLNAYNPHNFTDCRANAVVWGRLVESAVGAHLINNVIKENYQLYYWRETNQEVDFILEKNGKLIALEVKSGKSAKNEGMNIFAQKFNPSKTFMIGGDGISAEEFLTINPVKLF